MFLISEEKLTGMLAEAYQEGRMDGDSMHINLKYAKNAVEDFKNNHNSQNVPERKNVNG